MEICNDIVVETEGEFKFEALINPYTREDIDEYEVVMKKLVEKKEGERVGWCCFGKRQKFEVEESSMKELWEKNDFLERQVAELDKRLSEVDNTLKEKNSLLSAKKHQIDSLKGSQRYLSPRDDSLRY